MTIPQTRPLARLAANEPRTMDGRLPVARATAAARSAFALACCCTLVRGSDGEVDHDVAEVARHVGHANLRAVAL